jgi:transposase-like protein
LGEASIYRWVKKYVGIISEYVNSLNPQLSETWHADELFVKVKGGRPYYGNTNMGFLWNVMDRKTRFLLASKLSKHRDVGGAARALREAKNNARGSQPERILTDSLKAYREGMSFVFGREMPQHIENVGINKPHATNNRIERLNGTLRERVKVQRGWKTMKTPIAEGQRIHYNFVKPHQALDGQTPAQMARVSADKDTWNSLLRLALTTRNETPSGTTPR